jgi:hypothetical protein
LHRRRIQKFSNAAHNHRMAMLTATVRYGGATLSGCLYVGGEWYSRDATNGAFVVLPNQADVQVLSHDKTTLDSAVESADRLAGAIMRCPSSMAWHGFAGKPGCSCDDCVQVQQTWQSAMFVVGARIHMVNRASDPGKPKGDEGLSEGRLPV